MDYYYEVAVKEDVENAISEEYDHEELIEKLSDVDAFKEELYDKFWTYDSITGNGSGSYTFSTYEAEECLCHNLDLLIEAVEEFGGDLGDTVEKGAENCDVTIRCYLLSRVIDEIVDELYEENEKEVEEYINKQDEEEETEED